MIPGVQNLSQFVASSNVVITSAPVLTDIVGDVWRTRSPSW